MTTVVIGDNTGDDFAGLEDDRIDSPTYAYNQNQGGHSNGFCGHDGSARTMKELQRFDLSSLPSIGTVTGTSLHLYDTDWASRTADCTINAYEISAANSDWVEGTGIDTTQVGSSCWNKKIYDTVSWAGSAGLSTATTDYINTSLGSAIFTDGVSGYRTITFNSTGESVVEGWLGDATNAGWILVGSGSGAYWTQWDSAQGTDGQRPYLTVVYTTGAAGAIINQLQGSNMGADLFNGTLL